MDRVHDVLRSGAWLTRERIRLVAIAVLFASAVGLIYLLVTAHGLVDIQGRPLGTDFSSFYAAGTHVLDGNPDAPYDLSRQYRARTGDVRRGDAILWLALSAFLSIHRCRAGAAALRGGACGHGRRQRSASICWRSAQSSLPPSRHRSRSRRFRQQAVDLRPALAPARARLPRCSDQCRSRPERLAHRGARWRRARHARPQADRRRHPVRPPGLQAAIRADDSGRAGGEWTLAHFFLRRRHGRVLAAAATLVFGWQVWHAFLESTHFTRLVVLEQGDPGWYKMQSVFAWARMWGAPIPLAYALQGAMMTGLAAALIWTMAQRNALPAQGGRSLSRHDPGYALYVRLRHDGAGAGHRFLCRRRPDARLRPVGENGARDPLADAACGAQFRTNNHDTARRADDTRTVHSVAATQHVSCLPADSFFRQIPSKVACRSEARRAVTTSPRSANTRCREISPHGIGSGHVHPLFDATLG